MFVERMVQVTTQASHFIALAGLAGLLILAIATVLEVIMRWLPNKPIVGLNDTYSMIAAVIIASSFPVTIALRGNITIRFVGKMFGRRMSNIIDAFGNIGGGNIVF